jgi:hypothetical protein
MISLTSTHATADNAQNSANLLGTEKLQILVAVKHVKSPRQRN